MSDVIPEKGVCRIVIESIDKDDDYCSDIDAESEIDPNETSNIWEEDKFPLEYKNDNVCCSKEYDKRKNWMVKSNACSSDSDYDEHVMERNKPSALEHYEDREERPLLQTVPDLSNMVDENLLKNGSIVDENLLENDSIVDENLLENDNNTIRKSFTIEHQSNSFEEIDLTVPEIHSNSIVNLKSYMEMTDAVRRLTEVLALPINQRETKENNVTMLQKSEFIERENTDGGILTEETTTCSSTIVCFNSHNINHHLENYPSPVLRETFQPNATYETYNTNLDKSLHISRATQGDSNKEVEFTNDILDFNMAVEALNLLKSKGRNVPNSIADHNDTLQIIGDTPCYTSDTVKTANEPSLPVPTNGTYSADEPFSFCSSIEKISSELLFDSTLEITDCTTGATIPFESFYKCNNDLLTADENDLSYETQTENGIIPTKLTQLSDIVTSVKIPLSIACDHDKQSQNKEISYRYSAYQVEPGKPNSNILADNSLTISTVLPETETKVRKEHEFKPKSSLNYKRKSKIEIKEEVESNLQYKQQSSITSSIKAEEYKNDHNISAPKILTKKLCVEPKKKEFNEELEEFKQMLEKRRTTEPSKTPDFSIEHSVQHSSSITQNNGSLVNENFWIAENYSKPLYENKQCAENSKIKNQIPNDFFSSPPKRIEILNQTLLRPANENENRNSDNPKLLSQEKQVAETLQTLAIIDKIRTPLDAFSLIITDGIFRKIVKYTNEKLIGTSTKPAILGKKKSTNETELKSFIGLLLISAALRHNNVRIADLWSECFGPSIYRTTLKEGRFNILVQKVCFGDDTPSTGTIAKSEVYQIGDLLEEYHQNCKKYPLTMIETRCNSTLKEEHIKQHFTSVRKTKNFHLSILFSMLDTAIIRGTAIYRNKYPKSGMRLRTFFKDVGMALVKPQLEEKLIIPTNTIRMKELIKDILNIKPKTCNDYYFISVTDPLLKKVKRCQLCSWNKDRKTRHHCIYCKRSMCREHRARLCTDCINIS